MTTTTYEYDLTIEIPTVPPHLANMGAPLILTSRGTVTVADPAGITDDQIREYVVNEAAKDHIGKTVQITHWRLTPVGQEVQTTSLSRV